MQIKIFTIPIIGGEDSNNELNKFLAAHRIIDVQQTLVAEQYWTFCVKYLDGTKPDEAREGTKKIDYKELLSEGEFARFNALRAARKKISADEGVPAYAVFTDAELAEMSKLKQLTAGAAKGIKGINKSRAHNYIEKILNAASPDLQAITAAEAQSAPDTPQSAEASSSQPPQTTASTTLPFDEAL